jgi:hypothetical protein
MPVDLSEFIFQIMEEEMNAETPRRRRGTPRISAQDISQLLRDRSDCCVLKI